MQAKIDLKIELQRPLVFFDLETTSLEIETARIVEIALIKVYPDGRTESFLTRINPEIPIPAEVSRIHGITNFDVMDKPTFRDIAIDVEAIIKGCDLAGYNLINYDFPVLLNELKRAGIAFSTDEVHLIDVMVIFKLMERRNLEAAYRFYCQKELDAAHSALKDTQATLEVFLAQLNRYADLPQTVDKLHAFCNPRNDRFVDSHKKFIWQNGEACFTFGKYKGQPLRKIVQQDAEYLTWITRQDFAPEVVRIIQAALQGQFPQPPQKPQASNQNDIFDSPKNDN